METSPESVTTPVNKAFSIICTATPELDGQWTSLDVQIEWRRIAISPLGEESVSVVRIATHVATGVAVNTLTISENDVGNVTYHCTARVMKVTNTSFIPIILVPGTLLYTWLFGYFTYHKPKTCATVVVVVMYIYHIST